MVQGETVRRAPKPKLRGLITLALLSAAVGCTTAGATEPSDVRAEPQFAAPTAAARISGVDPFVCASTSAPIETSQ